MPCIRFSLIENWFLEYEIPTDRIKKPNKQKNTGHLNSNSGRHLKWVILLVLWRGLQLILLWVTPALSNRASTNFLPTPTSLHSSISRIMFSFFSWMVLTSPWLSQICKSTVFDCWLSLVSQDCSSASWNILYSTPLLATLSFVYWLYLVKLFAYARSSR